MNVINAIIIESNRHKAQEIYDILEMHCPYVNIVRVAEDVDATNKLIQECNFDLIIIGLDTGLDFAFKVLKESNNFAQKELIIINTNSQKGTLTYINCDPDGILQSIDSSQMVIAIHQIKQQMFPEEKKLNLNIIPKKITQIGIPSLKEVKIVNINTILYLKSEGKYTLFCTKTNNKFAISSRNLGSYEKLLSLNNFLRVHNSYLVNMDNALNVQKKDGIYLKMENNEFIPVSKRKKEILFSFLGIKQ